MIDFKFADIGEGIHEGQILKWFFEVGDTVEEGETLVLIETDKVNAEIPAPESGILQKRGAEVGETIHVGETLAVIGDDAPKKEDPPKKTESVKENSASVVGAIEASDDLIEASQEHETQPITPSNDKVLATPVARKMAKEKGLEITQIIGTGPQGRVMKIDIMNASKQAPQQTPQEPHIAQPQVAMPTMPKAGIRREKITSLRKSIVKAMNTSNQLIPATTVMDEFDVTELVQFRNTQKTLAEKEDMKLTYLPFIIKAVVLTLKKYPIFNASFDHETEEILYKSFYNIGIAVDTHNGLVVPNVKNADQKSLFELAKDTQSLAALARDKKLSLDDLSNTTFSITNYGAFGSKLGTPVIKHPEVAILGMGAITKQPQVVNDAIVIRDMFPVSLTIDHRIIDGGDAGRFMVQLKTYLSNPMLLLLS